VQELGIAANAIEILCDSKEEVEKMAHEYLSATRNAFFIVVELIIMYVLKVL
jgi:glutamine---fructose-6-phosphate transaminase (isomerizing)